MRGEDVVVVRRVVGPTLEEALGAHILQAALKLHELRLNLDDLEVDALDEFAEVAPPRRELLLHFLDELVETRLGLLRLLLEDLEARVRVRREALQLRLERVPELLRHDTAVFGHQRNAVIVLHVLVLEGLDALGVVFDDRREFLPDRRVLRSGRILRWLRRLEPFRRRNGPAAWMRGCRCRRRRPTNVGRGRRY